MPFNIEFFNGAPHAGASRIPLPVQWADGKFAIDLVKLTGRRQPARERKLRLAAMRREFRAWADENVSADRLYPPDAFLTGTSSSVETLAALMLSGQADIARLEIRNSWPRDPKYKARVLGGETAFWNDLCLAIVDHPYWQRFGLERIPHAPLITTAAAKARH